MNKVNIITMDQAITLCQEIYPNLSWQVYVYYISETQYGRICGTTQNNDQYMELVFSNDNSALVSLYDGSPDNIDAKKVEELGEICQLETDQFVNLKNCLERMQRRLLSLSPLALIYANERL